ncbi:MAG: HlyD family secretion protein [Polyangiaceae bacterium]|nr:HlyD family secretion protein [Polyangiaceae bacterium]
MSTTTNVAEPPVEAKGRPAAPAHPQSSEAKAEATAARSKSGRRRVFVILAIGALAIAGYLVFHVLGAHRQSTDDAQIEADVVAVAPRISGLVAVVRVGDNAAVKKGDVLVELDTSELAARCKQAEGELAAAKAQSAAAEAQAQVAEAGARGGLSTAQAQVSTSLAQVSSADAQIAAAQAQLARAQADVRRYAADLDRTRTLRKSDAVSAEALDNAQAAFDAAQAGLTAAQAQLRAAAEARGVAQSRVAEAHGVLDTNTPVDAKVAAARAAAELAAARVTTAEAALELARLSLSYATVTAPADGLVSKLTVHAGQLVSPGMAIGELVPFDTYVVANFKETQVGEMKPGQAVDLEVDAFGGRTFHGVVDSLSGATGSRFSLLPPDNASGNFVKVVQRIPVRIRWADASPDVALRPGMSVAVTVHTDAS